MLRAIIASNKFNYGHLSGLMAWYSALRKCGIECAFFLDMQYINQIDINEYRCITEKEKIGNVDILIIFNISTKDLQLIKLLKKYNKNLKVIFIYHEPWRGIGNEVERFNKDYKNFIKQIGRMLFARPILKESNIVVCPSQQALSFYNNYENKINKHAIVFPLMFKDDCIDENFKKNKLYFSYISTASMDKGFDVYIEFIKYAHKIDKTIKFSITTSTDIHGYIDDEIKEMIDENVLSIKHGKGLSEKEMNEAYDNSLCTWLVYRSSTQSGVIAKALMWGSPCVATPVGVFSELIDGNNGIIVENINDFKGILEAFQQIREHQFEFENNARNTFTQVYSADERVDDVHNLIQSILKD